MQQSNFIFGILLIAYIVFITVKGELGQYLALFKGAGTPANTTSSNASGIGGLAQLLGAGGGLLSNIFGGTPGQQGPVLNSLNSGLNSITGNTNATSNYSFQNSNTFAPGQNIDTLFAQNGIQL